MKGRGKRDTTVHVIFRVVSRFPRYISCYIAENRLLLGQCSLDWFYRLSLVILYTVVYSPCMEYSSTQLL